MHKAPPLGHYHSLKITCIDIIIQPPPYLPELPFFSLGPHLPCDPSGMLRLRPMEVLVVYDIGRAQRAPRLLQQETPSHWLNKVSIGLGR